MVNLAFLSLYLVVSSVQANQEKPQQMPQITEQQAKALSMLNQQETEQPQVKNLRLQISKLADSQGQVYLGAIVSRADLLPYLTQLKALLTTDFAEYRANQSARDKQSFHLTLVNPLEYPHVDKQLVEQLLKDTTNINFSSQLRVTLMGLGKAEKFDTATYFVVAQSQDAQLIRQRLLLPQKDFHVTLAFKPSDIYDVKKDASSLINVNL